jgi:acetyltransferase-like isoleucine patch superfamily enzyme
MANNITILDSTATTQSMRTTETGGIHFPHHIVESGSISISNFPVTQPISIASVTIGNSVTIAGTVTASISNFPATQAISIASVTIGNSVTIGSLPAISGTVTIGNTVTIAGTVTANTLAIQGTTVTTANFTSTTPSTVLASFNAGRKVLTIFNEGAGNLHVCAGATCTTIAYQVRLSAGDYYEASLNQTSLTHSAVFATAGTARVTQIS